MNSLTLSKSVKLKVSLTLLTFHFSLFISLGPGGDKGSRTPDLLRARQALYQLSYVPRSIYLVGLPGLEPGTSPLSGVRSNQLSYSPTPMIRVKELTSK